MTPTQSPTLASQATAELPKLPELEQPLILIHPTSLQRMILAYATAYGLACYEAGRASRAQSEPSDKQLDDLIQSHGTGGWQTVSDMRKFARAVLAATTGETK